MTLRRFLRHLLAPSRASKGAFPPAALAKIEEAIAQSERRHRGQIRFAVEASLEPAALFRGTSAADRALEVFSSLRVWDTEHNNGVLIYLLLADRDVEIIADRGIHARVGAPAWETICRDMEAEFRSGRFDRGVIEGIAAVSRHLETHFPGVGGSDNEMADRPVLL